MTVARGFGVSALISRDYVQPLATAAEKAGYVTFWVNDVPGANGLEQLARAQAATATVRLGVGVLPIDRWSGDRILREIERLKLEPSRLALGIGSGALQAGALRATATACQELKASVSAAVLVGALGPSMCELAGREADGVILNWLVPATAPALVDRVEAGASEAGRSRSEVVAYVRTACHADARATLEREAAGYEGYPAYKRHFERQGVRAIETTVNGSSEEITIRFEQFSPRVDEVVARAIAQEESLAAYLAVLNAAAPDGG